MSTETKDEINSIRVLPFSGLQCDWDEWSEKYQGIAAERGYLQVMLGNEHVPSDSLDIDQKVENKYLRVIPHDTLISKVSNEIEPLVFLFEFPQQILISYRPIRSLMQSKL